MRGRSSDKKSIFIGSKGLIKGKYRTNLKKIALLFNVPLPGIFGCKGAAQKVLIQGHREFRSESYCLLLPKYVNYGLFNPTGGSPDVVHLII